MVGTGVNYSAPPAYAAAPPPGYPVNGATPYARQVPLKTKQRGDGFWKGCGVKYAAAPPLGYPVNGAAPTTQQVPLKTKQRGDGFWKGCGCVVPAIEFDSENEVGVGPDEGTPSSGRAPLNGLDHGILVGEGSVPWRFPYFLYGGG
ncbi:hypothetical protein KSP40_PGU012004 [Platanthera guangdongensis]|uniref:Uncharacterized protein n=1 Tax=Platanthera guangdongensis TaxID=2320717 RepID=A0ABR2N223_9ASPA